MNTRLLVIRTSLLAGALAVSLLVLLVVWRGSANPFLSNSSSLWKPIKPDDVPRCGYAWRVVGSPNPSKEYSEIHAIAASPDGNLWAAGTAGTEEYALTFTLRRAGREWQTLPSPSVPEYSNHLHSIAALSSSDVWTVGASHKGTDLWRTLAMHWDGSAWKVVPSPNAQPITATAGTAGVLISRLNAVAAVAHEDVWAVGEQATGPKGRSQPLFMHWDGTAWKIAPLTGTATFGVLNGAKALSPTNIWAVGSAPATGSPGASVPLVMRWDGKAWAGVPTPLVQGELWAVDGISRDDLWAVGNSNNATLVMHWNGTAWKVVSSPNPASATNSLSGVAAIAPNDVWAVGALSDEHGDGTLALHWDGKEWSYRPSPSAGAFVDILSGAVALGGEVWAAGSYITDAMGTNLTLIERYSDPCGPTPGAK